MRVYRPIDSGNAVLPGIVYIHGGGWTIGSIGKNLLYGMQYRVHKHLIYNHHAA